MELRLEIKLASVEELSTIAKALIGLQVGEVKPAPRTAPVVKVQLTEVPENVEHTEEEMIEVESPYTAHPSEEVKEAPAAKPKPVNSKQTAAEAKAAKKAQEEADRADRVARLKAQMETSKGPGTEALDKRAAQPIQDPAVEPVEAIVEEIKQLGDALMAFNGVPLEAKQKLTAEVMAKVGVPQGVRPTQLQQPMLGQFRDLYKASVNATVNPVMGGLV